MMYLFVFFNIYVGFNVGEPVLPNEHCALAVNVHDGGGSGSGRKRVELVSFLYVFL